MSTGAGPATGALRAADVAGAAVRVGEPGFVEGRLHWVGSATDGSGRSVLWSGAPGARAREASPPWLSVRSRLFGYGAGAWCATPLGLVAVDGATHSLVLLADGGATARSPALGPGSSIGDPVAVPGTALVVVAAEHRTEDGWRHGLDVVDVAAGTTVTLLESDGRCAEPQVAADGSRLAWLRWPRRTMPWQAAELWVADLDRADGQLTCRAPRRVDGGPSGSVGQASWLKDGALAYVSEAAGWWQPWVCDRGGVVRRVHGAHAEFQRPRWLTCRWLAPHGERSLACAFADEDGEHVGVLDLDGGLEVLDQPCVRIDGVAADDDAVAWVGATAGAQGVVLVASGDRTGDAHGATWGWRAVAGDPGHPTATLAPEGFGVVHDGVALRGVLWRPDGAAPWPLVVLVHPGPTGAVDRSYSPTVHLLVAHGIAVASLDYSGSTAHGRSHRTRLDGSFGVLDVAECTAAAQHLVRTGVARADAVFVRGTSAGGTTALLSLAAGTVRGAVAWYPASSFGEDDDEDDDEGFESGYLSTLLDDAAPASRSPLGRARALRGHALLIQGALDDVVPLAETRRLAAALSASLEECALVVVEGEGHGFRTDVGRAVALDAELAFYERLAAVPGDAPGAQYDAATAPPRAPAAGRP